MSELKIENLHVSAGDKEILKGVSLTFRKGETHALMGPNGNGKSTLLMTIMGHPDYTVTEGSITLDGKDVLAMSVDERSRAGIFLGMQNPQAIPGVTNMDFLKAAVNARREEPIRLFDFMKSLDQAIGELSMNEDLAHRYLNEGFSGGEKKRNEILQMELLKPDFALLDEIDSGLDVDALRVVAEVINKMKDEQDLGLVMVSHYEKLYQMVRPTHVHVLVDGVIKADGDFELVDKITSEGYEWLTGDNDDEGMDLYEQIFGFGTGKKG